MLWQSLWGIERRGEVKFSQQKHVLYIKVIGSNWFDDIMNEVLEEDENCDEDEDFNDIFSDSEEGTRSKLFVFQKVF